jgi:hypothetical protein
VTLTAKAGGGRCSRSVVGGIFPIRGLSRPAATDRDQLSDRAPYVKETLRMCHHAGFPAGTSRRSFEVLYQRQLAQARRRWRSSTDTA